MNSLRIPKVDCFFSRVNQRIAIVWSMLMRRDAITLVLPSIKTYGIKKRWKKHRHKVQGIRITPPKNDPSYARNCSFRSYRKSRRWHYIEDMKFLVLEKFPGFQISTSTIRHPLDAVISLKLVRSVPYQWNSDVQNNWYIYTE